MEFAWLKQVSNREGGEGEVGRSGQGKSPTALELFSKGNRKPLEGFVLGNVM